MPYITAVKYAVPQQVLESWLQNTFGDSHTEAGHEVWSCTLNNNDMRQVTAPREITSDEQNQLKERAPKRPPKFGTFIWPPSCQQGDVRVADIVQDLVENNGRLFSPPYGLVEIAVAEVTPNGQFGPMAKVLVS
ncbi:hypothetical protein FSARC_4279 [Fusarium sarcochroum]|uniref:Uncharacterized protein n=1 Tax=Fusarium sarcochroum TaxID=1208366 RepID=A0A8H4U2J1_9HYPO|nr:hypothetical protein FSARC_4279 [Fusarium sarcochroum]